MATTPKNLLALLGSRNAVVNVALLVFGAISSLTGSAVALVHHSLLAVPLMLAPLTVLLLLVRGYPTRGLAVSATPTEFTVNMGSSADDSATSRDARQPSGPAQEHSKLISTDSEPKASSLKPVQGRETTEPQQHSPKLRRRAGRHPP